MKRFYLISGLFVSALIVVGLVMWNSPRAKKVPVIDVVDTIPKKVPNLIEEMESVGVNLEDPAQPLKALPSLLESDDFVREELEAELTQPALAWLKQPDLVRRCAVFLENAARGEYPRRQLAFISLAGSYKIVRRGDRYFVDPSSYQRYDKVIDVLVSVPAQQLARLMNLLDPLLVEALDEIGVDVESTAVLIEDALENVLLTPLLTGEIELVRPSVLYEYADPRLESLSSLKKQLLRTGPKNLAKLQSYSRQLKVILGET